ncbi:MAG: histidine--tRNA ligase [Acidobacteria bacterium]|nr:histidine--tRNA ligase [Acidobacteriota bacterium]
MNRGQTIRAIKGMRDILPPESALWEHIEQVARSVFRAYAYQEIRTPLLEATDLFARGVGQETDIVTKEMYTFDDRDRQSLTLRPEATASVVRAYIEHRLHEQPGVKKLYYMGPMFRRERPQKGRYRQFYQIGAEAIGSESPRVDAEILEMLLVLLGRLRLTGFTLYLNSVGCTGCRPQYLVTLRQELAKVRDRLCPDCQRRSETNPLRVLDCKVAADQPIIDQLPALSGSLCAACREHFEQLQGYLKDRSIPFQLQPRMVRGLDYYTRTTFEITHGALGAQNALLGGGRYDGLSEALGGPPAPGIGFSIGEDRFALTIGAVPNDLPLYIAWMGESAYRHAAEMARELRAQNVMVELPSDPVKLKKALELASRLKARSVLIIGDKELAEGRYPLRDMARGEQRIVTKPELFQQFAGPAPAPLPSFAGAKPS